MIPENDRRKLVRVFEPALEEVMSMEAVRSFLIERITNLIESNIDLLMSALYRIDVYEHNVKEAFNTSTPQQLPEVLADLVIERQIQKIHIRQSYRKEHSDSSFEE